MVSPNPTVVGVDDLVCTVSAGDADGDTLFYIYEWSDSTGVHQTNSMVSNTSILLCSGLTADTWTCEVTPYVDWIMDSRTRTVYWFKRTIVSYLAWCWIWTLILGLP